MYSGSVRLWYRHFRILRLRQNLLRFLQHRNRRESVQHLRGLGLYGHQRQRDVMHQAVGWIVVVHFIRGELVVEQDAEPLHHSQIEVKIMPLQIVRNDITKMQVDAIVNAANETLLGGGGVDGCIHRAAGPELLAECRKLGGCKVGEAKMTGAYRLPCQYVIHTVGPVWNGGSHGEREQLVSCYRASLALAKEHECETVAFPLISSGIFGYPKDQALRVAVDTIGEFLLHNDMTVYLVIFDRNAYQISGKLFAEIAEYIDDHYADAHTDSLREDRRRKSVLQSMKPVFYGSVQAPTDTGALSDLLSHLDAGFSETLLQLIDRSGKKDAEIYKKANVDRKLFSKIRNSPGYRPSKSTAIAFAIALELDLDETRDLIARAGYALSPSSKFDVIIEYFIRQKKYDIFEINEALFAFDQSLLGA